MELITIKVFDDGISAHILKAKLEAEGIQCFVFDENIVTLNPLYNFAVGGVKLKINASDKEHAELILKELDETPYTTDADEAIKCPNCGSTALFSDFKSMKGAKGIVSTITSFLFGVFPIYFKSVYRCKNCDTEFKARQKNGSSN